MFGKLLRKLGLGPTDAQIADTILEGVADHATGGAASKVEDALESFKKRKRPAKR